MMSQLIKNKLSPIKIMLFVLRNLKCQGCGSKEVGDGKGTFLLTEEKFYRKCHYGYKVETVKLAK